MGTEKDAVNVSLLFPDPGEQKVVKGFDEIQRVVASGHSRLVRNHKDQKPPTVEHPYGLGHPGKNSETARMVDIPHLLIDGPVPIDEYRRFDHFPPLSKKEPVARGNARV